MNLMSDTTARLIEAADTLRRTLRPLLFSAPVTHVYNPLEYAWKSHCAYLERFGSGRKRFLYLGMNPGPFGMTQTGVPFGEIAAVRDWMGIDEPLERPANEHPKRPIQGFACRRSEVSGRRLWGWARDTHGAAKDFFRDHFVVNFCPLVFMEESGRNYTPDKVSDAEIAPVNAACDAHLRAVISILEPEWLIGVGAYAEEQFHRVAAGGKARISRIPHPSPANPAANRDWAGAVAEALKGVV